MKKVYWFTGIPGSGKSTLSRSFAEQEGIIRVSKDDEEVRLFEKFEFRSNEEKKHWYPKPMLLS